MDPLGPKTFDPKEAILHRLRYYASRALPCIPAIGTVQFLKARLLPTHQLHLIAFQDTSGQTWQWLSFLTQREDGSWVVQTSGGNLKTEQPFVPVDRPSVQFHSGQQMRTDRQGNATYEFRAGGEVFDNGFDITRVRLIAPNGHMLEDTVQDGLVLFWSTENIGLSLQAELYNRAGKVVSQQPLMQFPSLPSSIKYGIFQPFYKSFGSEDPTR
jgi:hypothetical protein